MSSERRHTSVPISHPTGACHSHGHEKRHHLRPAPSPLPRGRGGYHKPRQLAAGLTVSGETHCHRERDDMTGVTSLDRKPVTVTRAHRLRACRDDTVCERP